MDDLNPKARALIDAGRGAFRASDGDRERIEAALRTRLGSSALPADADVAHVSPLARGAAHVSPLARGAAHVSPLARGAARFDAASTGFRAAARLAIGGAVVATAFLALRPGAPPAPTRSAQAPVAAPAVTTHEAVSATPDATAPAPDVAPTIAPHSNASAPAASRKPDRLAQEVALMSRATAALRSGQAAKALRALDEHARKFPRGALTEDRRAAKAQALCLIGHVSRGRAELALLPPRSPAAARAEQVCDAGSLATPPQ